MLPNTPITPRALHWAVLVAATAITWSMSDHALADDYAVAADTPVWHRDVSTAWQQAVEEDRPLLMFISTASCGHCRRMKSTTYADPNVAALVGESVVAVAIDGKRQRSLVRRHLVRSYPTTLVISPDGREVGRFVGYVSPSDFRRRLARAVDLSVDPQYVAERPTRLR